MVKSVRSGEVVLVGPSHPYAGGIAQHTTRLALELEKRGHDVVVESWKAQYPKALYPGPDRVPRGEPEVGVPSRLREKLAWYSPLSWWLAGWRHRHTSVVGLNIPTPFHAVPYLVFLRALGRSTRRVAIVHNPLPHEPSAVDRTLMSLLLKRFDTVIVHNEKARDIAIELGVKPSKVVVHSLPSPWPADNPKITRKRQSGPTRLLFFGTIRRYKGLDNLLKALAEVPEVELTVAGEFWEDQAPYDNLVNAGDLSKRVTIRSGYVAQSEFGELFGGHDVAVLPYRSGTGSIVRELAFRFGLPVIATDVGSIGEGIVDGVNGLIVPADSIEALVIALKDASSPTTVGRWKKGLGDHVAHQQRLWLEYCEVFESPGGATKESSHA